MKEIKFLQALKILQDEIKYHLKAKSQELPLLLA
jgi:hypothetical protein